MLFALPTFTSRRLSGAISVYASCNGFLVSLAPSHHGPGHSGKLVGKRNGGDLGRSPGQQCRRARGGVGRQYWHSGRGSCTGHEQAARSAVTLLLMLPSLSLPPLGHLGAPAAGGLGDAFGGAYAFSAIGTAALLHLGVLLVMTTSDCARRWPGSTVPARAID